MVLILECNAPTWQRSYLRYSLWKGFDGGCFLDRRFQDHSRLDVIARHLRYDVRHARHDDETTLCTLSCTFQFGKNTREATSRPDALLEIDRDRELIKRADVIRMISIPWSSAIMHSPTNEKHIWNNKRSAKSPLKAPRCGGQEKYWLFSVIL